MKVIEVVVWWWCGDGAVKMKVIEVMIGFWWCGGGVVVVWCWCGAGLVVAWW